MHLSRRSLLGTGLAAGAALGAPTLLTESARAQGRATSVLRFIPSTPLPSLDPIVVTSYNIRNHGYLIYDTLFATDANFQIRPQMVEHWESSPDGLKWTFALRPGLLFHDNQPVTAADCIASIKRWSARDAFGQTFATFVEGYQPVDARTFSITLKRPFPALPAALGKLSSNVPFIMPERVAATDPTKPLSDTIGSGPWRFDTTRWVPGQSSAYERFAAYKPREEAPSWAAGGKIAKVDRVEWLPLTEASSASGALMQGEADWWEQPPVDLVEMLKKDRNISVTNVPLGLMLLMRFNHTQAPFNNPKVRQAVAMAVNQADYMQAVAGNPAFYEACKSYFPCHTPLSTGAGGQNVATGNLEKAKQLLQESGYKGEKVVHIAAADQPLSYAQSLVTVELLKKLGMNAEFITVDWGTFIGRRSNRGPVDQGGWSIFHTYWSSADMLTPALNPLLRTNGPTAWFGWPNDPELEGLRDKWLASADAAQQKTVAEAIETRAFQELPYVPCGMVQQPMAIRKNLTGMVLAPVQFFWNIEKKA